MVHSAVVIGAASRPFPGETANGDAWRVDWTEGACRIALIDALGHGPEAELEAQRAVAALGRQPTLRAEASVWACHQALVGGRGAAVAIVELDLESKMMTFCGLGNVEGVLWTDAREQRLTTDRGIVGTTSRALHPISLRLGDQWVLVLHSDGVKSRFRVRDLVSAGTSDPALLARTALDRFGRDTDDATVLVANAAATRTV